MKKFNNLSPALKKFIVPEANVKPRTGTISQFTKKSRTPISDYAAHTLMHCNGGSTMQAALWLKDHLDNGGKLVVTIAGALSSFQVGVMLAELIRQGKVHLSRLPPPTMKSRTTATSPTRTTPTSPELHHRQ